MILNRDIFLSPEGKLEFAEGIIFPQPDVRKLSDAKDVLLQAIPLTDEPLYYMYRGVSWQEDIELFKEHNIRYDLTVVLPKLLGQEYNKTVGHFHPVKPHSTETYPEYYEVLSGEAIYLLQRNSRSGEVEEIMAVEAKKGDKVFIPSGFGHITINPGPEPLVMANLIEANFSSLYLPFRDKHGAAYYYIAGEEDRGEFIKNPHYHQSVGLQLVAAPSLPQPIAAVKETGLYPAFVEQPQDFAILV